MAHFINLIAASQPTTISTSFRNGLIPKPLVPSNALVARRIRCSAHTIKPHDYQTTIRRSGNYKPPYVENDHIQSLKNEYAGQKHIDQCTVLKEQVKMMLEEVMEPLNQLELIDTFQRLGISYHFQQKILSMLQRIYDKSSSSIMPNQKGLYATALKFRLLRQHGFNVSQDIFDCFKDNQGKFEASLCDDMKGILSLYEASFLLTEGESTLELAREFAAEHLKNLDQRTVDEELAELVRHALELPLHWRMERLEARWFIKLYQKRPEKYPALLDLAKLDFNIVQAIYQDDLKYASSWWEDTRLAENLTFARDRVVECFFWTVGSNFYPEQGYCRRMLAKVIALVTIIDDAYDVYGTMDELQLFTDAVERWEIKAVDHLPDYMKICFLALYNTINEMAYDALKEQGVHIISYLRNSWAELCKRYLKEAKWYSSGYAPTLQEYLDHAWVSVATPVVLVHSYFCVSNPIRKEALEHLERYHDIIRCSGTLSRLMNDLGTSPDELKRGDILKSVQLYMKETGASEEEAREYIRSLINETWKELNKERVAADSPFCSAFVRTAVDLGRMAQCIYQYGDGHGHVNSITKDRIWSLLAEPIHLD